MTTQPDLLTVSPVQQVRIAVGLKQFGAPFYNRWTFYISSFSPDGKTGHALNERDELTDVPITPAGVITVAGRKYGPRQWDH